MKNSSYSFKIGDFECKVISDGTILTPGPPAPGSSMPDMEHGQILDVLCLFIKTGKHKVLVDTGCGANFQSSAGKLLKNLPEAGISPEEIDIIIHTHGHTDHVCGSFDKQGRPVFPNARYIVARKEWETWNSSMKSQLMQALFADARKNYLHIPQQFELIEDKAEALPGIRVILAPGHSPGNSMLEISSGNKKMICIGDTIHDLREFTEPDYYSFLDWDPKEGIRSRTETLAKIAKSGTPVFASHFPFPGLGYIIETGNQLSWKPERFTSV